MNRQKFIEPAKSFFVDPDYKTGLDELGLTSINAVFEFTQAENLAKDNLPKHRSRFKFKINSPPATVFLKRYDSPPLTTQLGNWLGRHQPISCGLADFKSAAQLSQAGISTPKTIAYGQQRGIFFEKRSFIMTEEIPDAESLERKLPDCFSAPATDEKLRLKRDFIARLAAFVKKFHETGFRHRDLYLSHIFHSNTARFYLIDLARAFKPILMPERFRIKDIAQLHYSAPASHFSKTDRLRFYFTYTGRTKLARPDKKFIAKVTNKAKRIARHDIKHGRDAPFAH